MIRPPLPKAAVPDRWLLLAVFVVAAVLVLVRGAIGSSAGPLFADTDDAMRIVVVRDFLHGQNWYDLVQHRLNTPYGAEVHWSRLVDVPIAALILGFTPFLGAANATIIAGYLWPLLLLAVLLWLSGVLARRLVGPEAVLPALVLPLLSPAITAEFAAGRVDHHNVIIILTLAIAWTTIEALARPRFAIAAGILCATALAIATESIPSVAAAILVFGLIWVFTPQRGGRVRAFGLAFALAALGHLALARPPDRWLEGACDMLSATYVLGAVIVGVAFLVVTTLPASRQVWLRFALLTGLGVAGLIGLLSLYPECLKGPYGALDTWLVEHWINQIAEAKPLYRSVLDLPAYSIGATLPILLGLIVIVVRLIRVPHERGEWLALLAFLGLTAVVMLSQIRGARLAIMPAIPAAAWLIVAARQRYLTSPRLRQALGMAAAWSIFAGALIAMLVTGMLVLVQGHSPATAQTQADRAACLVPSAFADLAALPPERIMTPVDLGSHMLLQTPHAVVSAPYHRDAQGVRDTFDFFSLPIDQARSILVRRGIGLVVTCPAMIEMAGLPDRAPDSFSALVERNALPAWLADVTPGDGPLRIYAVLPQ